MNCPKCAGAGVRRVMSPIPGMVKVDDNGHQIFQCVCPAGHTQWFRRLKRKGPCPNCGHKWVEPVRGGAAGNTPSAAPEHVKVRPDGSTNIGIQGFVYGP